MSRCQWDRNIQDAASRPRGCYRVQSNVSAVVATDERPGKSALFVQNTTEHVLQQLRADIALELTPSVSEDEGLSCTLA